MLKEVEKLILSDPNGWKAKYSNEDQTLREFSYGKISICFGYKELRNDWVCFSRPITKHLNFWERHRMLRLLDMWGSKIIAEESVKAAQRVLQERQRELEAIIMESDKALMAEFDKLEPKPKQLGWAEGLARAIGGKNAKR